MMQKSTPSENSNTGKFVDEDCRLGDAVKMNHLMSKQVSAEELAEWLRYTEVHDYTTDDANANISNKTSSRVNPKRQRCRRRSSNFFDRRRSSLDDPGSRPSFGLDAQALLDASFDVKNGGNGEARDLSDRTDIVMSPPLEKFFGSVIQKNTGKRSRSSTHNSSEFTKNRSPFDRPIHGPSFDAPALSSMKYHVFLDKKHSQDNDNSLQLQPLSAKKRRVPFSTDTGHEDSSMVLESNTNAIANKEFSGRHERIRRCHSNREEYNSVGITAVRSNHDISPRHGSLDLSSPSTNNELHLHFPRWRAPSTSSLRRGENDEMSGNKFLISLKHSQESSDFIFRFESRRQPNHIVPIDKIYSRLEANAKSGKTRKFLVNALQRDSLMGTMLENGFGNETIGENVNAIGSENNAKRESSMMTLDNHFHLARNNLHSYQRQGIVGSSNQSFQSHYSQIMHQAGKITKTTSGCSYHGDCGNDNYKFICHEDKPSNCSRVEDDFYNLCQKVKAEEQELRKKQQHRHSAHRKFCGFENIDDSGKHRNHSDEEKKNHIDKMTIEENYKNGISYI
mmetsp:Transcript_23974/g.50521  ORF Transcript_23974/g.50521 Transcript_23974/m.50521 type:complete len:564 (+) Transcript_23974:287-1978(+)